MHELHDRIGPDITPDVAFYMVIHIRFDNTIFLAIVQQPLFKMCGLAYIALEIPKRCVIDVNEHRRNAMRVR